MEEGVELAAGSVSGRRTAVAVPDPAPRASDDFN